jgi:septal ring factor EnvC (AmiA/AmiB activator)
MDQNFIFDLIKDNSVVGAAGSAALVLLYKIWRIIQSDRKGDNLDQAEKEFRDEMRTDIKQLREHLKSCEEEKSKILEKMSKQNRMLSAMHAQIRVCQLSPDRPTTCPLLERFPFEE